MTLPSSSRQADTDPSSTTTTTNQTHTTKRKRESLSNSIDSPPHPIKKSRQHQQTLSRRHHDIDHLETTLDHLKTDCILIDVVLKSLQSFFPIKPLTTEEQLDQVDKELGLAYDDMLSQIRVLYRNVVKLDRAIKSIPSNASSP